MDDQFLSVSDLIKELQQYNPKAKVNLLINCVKNTNFSKKSVYVIDTSVETLFDGNQIVTIEGNDCYNRG